MTPATAPRGAVSAWAGICLLLFLLPCTERSWHARDGGGEARHSWSLGLPASPWISLTRSGAGPIEGVRWQAWQPNFHWASYSWLLLAGALAPRFFRGRERKPGASSAELG